MRPRLSAAVVLVAVAAVAVVACGGDPACGLPDDVVAPGLAAAAGETGLAARYDGFTATAANDCPAGGDVVSVTIAGTQVAPAPALPAGLALCLPRPELVGEAPIPLDDAARILFVGVSLEGGGCRLVAGAGAPATGTASLTGFCAGAARPFLLALDGTVAAARSCAGDAGAAEPVTLVLSGAALVSP